MRPLEVVLVLSLGGCAASAGAEQETASTPAAARVVVAEPPVAAEAPVVAFAAPAFVYATGPSGKFRVGWRPVGGPVPVNELFELELRVERVGSDAAVDGTPLVGAKVQLSAWMPEHLHGMNRRPQTSERAPGDYLVRGMLLHMEGSWQLFVDVMEGGDSERVEFPLTLQ